MSRQQQENGGAASRLRVAVGYARLPENDDYADGLEAQRRLIRSEARRRGVSLAWSCDTSDRRESLDRAGIARSLRLLRSEGHAALIVADLACLTRALSVLSAIFRRSAEEGWAIVSLGHPRVDTDRREGKVLQSILSRYNGYLDVDEQRPAGRPAETKPPTPLSLKERIVWARITGASLGQIANGLNSAGIAAPGESDSWLPSAVWAELETLRPIGL
jgi:hypothetical protein